MPALFLSLLAFLLALLALTAWAMTRGPVAWRRVAVGRSVSVALKAGPSISGILIAQRGDLLVLARAKLHEEGAPPVELDGELVIERQRVSFVQVLAPPSEV